MNIGSGNSYPSNALSNFAPHSFVFDGVECASMEGFLQSLKYDKEHIQIEVCKLVGKAAKFKGKKRNKAWKKIQTLWWKGVPMKRSSPAYRELLIGAYVALSDNPGFKKALLASEDSVLTHSIGSSKESETVLTEREFCSILTKLRANLKYGNLHSKIDMI
jgi:hypothetical protein